MFKHILTRFRENIKYLIDNKLFAVGSLLILFSSVLVEDKRGFTNIKKYLYAIKFIALTCLLVASIFAGRHIVDYIDATKRKSLKYIPVGDIREQTRLKRLLISLAIISLEIIFLTLTNFVHASVQYQDILIATSCAISCGLLIGISTYYS